MSKKSWSISYSNLLYKKCQDFLDIHVSKVELIYIRQYSENKFSWHFLGKKYKQKNRIKVNIKITFRKRIIANFYVPSCLQICISNSEYNFFLQDKILPNFRIYMSV